MTTDPDLLNCDSCPRVHIKKFNKVFEIFAAQGQEKEIMVMKVADFFISLIQYPFPSIFLSFLDMEGLASILFIRFYQNMFAVVPSSFGQFSEQGHKFFGLVTVAEVAEDLDGEGERGEDFLDRVRASRGRGKEGFVAFEDEFGKLSAI